MIDLYLDLDGVFADLQKKVIDIFGRGYEDIPSSELWATLGKESHLFRNLEMIPNSIKLFEFVQTIPNVRLSILTSLPNPTENLYTASIDKILWVDDNLSKTISVNTVYGGIHKAAFVKHPSDILIDDLTRNINAWSAAGGTGILHTSVESTISQLKIIFDL